MNVKITGTVEYEVSQPPATSQLVTGYWLLETAGRSPA